MKKLFGFLMCAIFALAVSAQGTITQYYSYDVQGKLNTRQSLLVGAKGTAVTSAAVEVRDTLHGVLLPKVTTTQRNAIATPAQGLLVYNTSTHALNCYIDTSWQSTGFASADSATIYRLVPTAGATFYCTNCTGSGVTGRLVSYFGSAWRRLKYD